MIKKTKATEYYLMSIDRWGFADVVEGPYWTRSDVERMIQVYGSNHIVGTREIEIEYFVEDED